MNKLSLHKDINEQVIHTQRREVFAQIHLRIWFVKKFIFISDVNMLFSILVYSNTKI